jgi:mRNA interferase MazF
MSVTRGDVVLVDFPFAGGGTSKVRPALIVQNDRDNGRLTNTVVAMITSRTQRATEPTQLFLDVSTPEGRQTGLIMNSVINCVNLFTIEQRKVLRTLGRISPALLRQIDDCLKAAFSLS